MTASLNMHSTYSIRLTSLHYSTPVQRPSFRDIVGKTVAES